MSAAVVKAIFRHQRWQTDRVVHFIVANGDALLLAAFGALLASGVTDQQSRDYVLHHLYYLGSPEEANHEPRSA